MQRPESPGNPVVLVVEDERLVSWAACRDLTRWGYHAISAASLAEARAALVEHRPDIILLDIRLPDGRGLDLLAELPAQGGPSVIVVSAIGEPATIVEATKLGAADFLTKPCAADDLHEALLRLNVTRIASPKPATIYAELGQHGILSHDPHMLNVLDSLQRFARTPRSTVLISGETGTGKSLAARALHQMSARAGGPFVEINCAAVPETLLESELMGHERGAFTDARSARVGLIESANRGTLFLDEIGDMPLGMQAKLLRFIETHTYRRLGSNTEAESDVRIVAASHMNLAELVAAGRFREDLFYRLKVLAVRLPPLRERPTDIDLIADHVLKACTREMGAHVNGLSLAARRILQSYRWPGNIRELKYAIEAAVTLCGESSFIEPVHLPPELQSLTQRHTGTFEPVSLPVHVTPTAHPGVSAQPQPFGAQHPGVPEGYGMAPGSTMVSQPTYPSPGPLPAFSEAERAAAAEDALQVVFRLDGSMALADLERVALERAMEYSEGNQVRAAKLLGVSRDLLRYRLKKFGLIE